MLSIVLSPILIIWCLACGGTLDIWGGNMSGRMLGQRLGGDHTWVIEGQKR